MIMEPLSPKPLLFPSEEIEDKSIISPESKDGRLNALIQVLIEWINDELAGERIFVKCLEDDLFDGQVLQKLIEKLSGTKIKVPEVTQSEKGQKKKLYVVLGEANFIMGIDSETSNKWNVNKIHSKCLIAVLHLLIALAKHFEAKIHLPENITIKIIIPQRKSDGTLGHRTISEELTGPSKSDTFDSVFEDPDKLLIVKNSLLTFVNKHLSKLHFDVTELESQFHDGVYFILLIGLLEEFFVPLYEYYVTPKDYKQKVHNVEFFFKLLLDTGLPKPKAIPHDIVNQDLKSIYRLIYDLFMKYRNI